MGLASKLAAAQASGYGGAPPGGAPPQGGGYPPQLQSGRPGGPPGQASYAPYPGGNPPYPGSSSSQGSYPPYSQSQQQPYQQNYQQSYQQPQYGQQPPYNQQPPYSQQPPYNQSYPAPPASSRGLASAAQPQAYGQPPYPSAPPPLPFSTKPGGAYGQPSQYPLQQGGPPPQGHPPQGQPSYGAPGQNDVAAYRDMLREQMRIKGLDRSEFASSINIEAIAQRAPAQVQQVCERWRVPKEVGQDIVKLALYDIIIYVDNSGSMRFEENGERIQDLKLILSRVAYASTLFDTDGVQIRFMNWKPYDMRMLDNIKSEQQIEQLLAGGPNSVQFAGLTPLGTELRNQVINPLILQKARSHELKKPVLVITITDGQPAGESRSTLKEVLLQARQEMQRYPQYGTSPLAFQFAQVGNDQPAREFLGELDADTTIGDIIDCTSNFENEQVEFMKTSGRELTPDLWLIKLLMGAIDPSYDAEDEKPGPGGRPPPPPQQGGYGGGYGAPGGGPGGYGGPPPQQNYPPQQGGYGQQGYGGQQGGYNRPPPGQGYPSQGGAYPGQQGGGYPPQGGSYPGQQGGQGGYGAPPPPPRY